MTLEEEENQRIFDAVVRLLGEKGNGDYAAITWRKLGVGSMLTTVRKSSSMHVVKLRPVGIPRMPFGVLGNVVGGATLCGVTPEGKQFSDVKILALTDHDGYPVRPTCDTCAKEFNAY